MFLFHTPVNIRKPLVLWCFQGLLGTSMAWMKNQAQLSWSEIVELAAVDVNIHMAATFDTFPANVPIIYPLKAP